jgi:hypothetical protein
MKYVLLEKTSEEPGITVLFIGETEAEVQNYLSVMKKFAKKAGTWNPSSLLVVPYDDQ